MPPSRTNRTGLLPRILIPALLLLLPVLLSPQPFYLHLLIVICYTIVLAFGVRLTVLIGQPTLGHAGFFGLGAFASAILAKSFGVPVWMALPLVGIIVGVAGAVIGYPALRLKGAYFLVLTLSVAEILRILAPSVIGGGSGGLIMSVPRFEPASLFFPSKLAYAYLAMVLAGLMFLLTYRVDRSRIGRILHALRESDDLSRSLGINVAKYRVAVFAIACATAGIAGSFFAHYNTVVSPELLGVHLSMYLIIYVYAGGADKILGPVVGTLFLVLLPELASGAEQYVTMIFGAVLTLIMLFLPNGVVSLWPRLVALRRKNAATPIVSR